MPNDVGKTGFWKERIENAERLGLDFLSVYCTTQKDWDYICSVHKKICSFFVSGNVLDIGCGYGRLSEWFNRYTGIDFSEDFVNKAKKIYHKNEFVVGDIKDMPFYDKEFDWAICVSIRGMIQRELGDVEWLKMEKEIKRVAKNILILEYSNPAKYEII